ncbi:unnamed protein product [Malus baccata var. baccata]
MRWLITLLSDMVYINKLHELPLTICQINRKPSHEEDFARRGAFPMYPTQGRLMFVPLTFDLPLAPQLQEVDVVLHKATDEIISINLDNSLLFSNSITYSRRCRNCKDRLKIQQILLGLEDLKAAGCCTIRGPNFLRLMILTIKPQVACGVADAHSMEYVDHSSTLYKFYVLGEKVYHVVKSSTPNADGLKKLSGSNELKPLAFDSLKSLSTAKGNLNFGDGNSSKATNNCTDLELVASAANWLMRKLGLTIFSFDVVIEEGTGDHVIVDVNYLPSFKEVSNEVAIPAFRVAINKKFELKRRK